MSLIVRGKIWGSTSMLFEKNNVEIDRIEVKKGGYCSKHMHEHKFNMFFVEKGKLKVVIYREDASSIIEDVTVLDAGCMTYVEPDLYHYFEGLEDTVAYEIYWVELNQNDIIRESVGGSQKI